MTNKELVKYCEQTFKDCLEILKAKNSDYAHSSNPFQNFSLGEHYGTVTTEQGFWVRLSDKFSRLSTFVGGGIYKVKEEKIDDVIIDSINYLILLKAYLHNKKKEKK